MFCFIFDIVLMSVSPRGGGFFYPLALTTFFFEKCFYFIFILFLLAYPPEGEVFCCPLALTTFLHEVKMLETFSFLLILML